MLLQLDLSRCADLIEKGRHAWIIWVRAVSRDRSRVRAQACVALTAHGENESGEMTASDKSSRTAGGRDAKTVKNRRALLVGSAGSIILLAVALILQAQHSWVLKVPTQWLAVALLPVLVGLALGGYISRFTFAGVEVEAPPLKPVGYVGPGSGAHADKTAVPFSRSSSWTSEREHEYERTHNLELVHIYKPSVRSGQRFDISIYLMRHHQGPEVNQTTGFAEIERAEFFFGPSWGDRVFTANNDGGVIGINTSAWGTFLASCRVVFRDGSNPVVIHRYIDFEMAP